MDYTKVINKTPEEQVVFWQSFVDTQSEFIRELTAENRRLRRDTSDLEMMVAKALERILELEKK